MDKRFVLILAVVLALLGGIFWFNKSRNSATSNNTNNNQKATNSNHTYGENTKGVVLIEYGDFQCPACGQYYPLVKQVKEKYKKDISFQFRHFPLVQIHPHAMEGSRAAEAAGLQGKFWEMHDMLYENQQSWSGAGVVTKTLESYATQLGLNVTKFKQDMASPVVFETINADIKSAQAAGGTGTPTFVLDGKRIEENPRDAEGFSKLIDEAIAKKKQ